MADETWAGVLSLANVKTYIMPGETASSTWDTPLQIIVDAVIAQVKQEVGCDIVAGTYTSEEVSGTGRTDLPLKHWPILTVTTVTDVDGVSYTVGSDEDYTIEDFCLRAPAGWGKGYENFIVTYTAGRATIPRDIVLVCYEAIKRRFQQMKGQLQGTTTRSFPDGSVAYSGLGDRFTKEELSVLAKYKRLRV